MGYDISSRSLLRVTIPGSSASLFGRIRGLYHFEHGSSRMCLESEMEIGCARAVEQGLRLGGPWRGCHVALERSRTIC
jgi:hypothetical protein